VTVWADEQFAGSIEPAALADPDRLLSLPECEIVKEEPKVKVGRLALAVGGRQLRIYVKRNPSSSWLGRLGALVKGSEARRCWQGARILRDSGFDTARPLAAVESRRWGLVEKSFYISEEIEGGMTLDRYWREAKRAPFSARRAFLERLAALFRRLHARRIYHNDLKDANIVVGRTGAGEERFYLLDLEGVRRCLYLSRRRRAKNLAQLGRTLGAHLGLGAKLFFLRHYLAEEFERRGSTRRWLRAIARETRRQDRRSLRRTG
jgi:tRNA A-37 threonylcarbamoyl transferase component Bud32